MSSISPMCLFNGLIQFAGELQVTVVHMVKDSSCPISLTKIAVVIFPSADFEIDLTNLMLVATAHEEVVNITNNSVKRGGISEVQMDIRSRYEKHYISLPLNVDQNQNVPIGSVFQEDLHADNENHKRIIINIRVEFKMIPSSITSGPRLSFLFSDI